MKLVIAANCQAAAYRQIFSAFLPKAEIKTYIVHAATHADGRSFERDVADADLILAFNVSDDFKVSEFRRSTITSNVGDKARFITNLYFAGYHPDFCYLQDMEGKRLNSVLGEYHSKICVIGALLGKNSATIVEALMSPGFGDEVGYREIFSASINELKNRDKNIDFGYAERFASLAQDDVHFLTFNHPKNHVYYDYASRILTSLGQPQSRLYFNQIETHGSGPILPVHPCVNDIISAKDMLRTRMFAKPSNVSVYLTPTEFVEASVAGYRQLDSALKSRIVQLPWAKKIVAAFGVTEPAF